MSKRKRLTKVRRQHRAANHRWYKKHGKDAIVLKKRKTLWRSWYDRNKKKIAAQRKTEVYRRWSRDKHLKLKYGISTKEYNKLLKAQGGKCAICRATPKAKGRRIKGYTKFCVDHCHKTLKIRGLLCAKCNAALGFLKDDLKVVSAAQRYMEAS